jgi:hypothetical protein
MSRILASVITVALFFGQTAFADVQPQPFPVGSQNATIKYLPRSSWDSFLAPGGWDKFHGNKSQPIAEFCIENCSAAQVNWTFPCK